MSVNDGKEVMARAGRLRRADCVLMQASEGSVVATCLAARKKVKLSAAAIPILLSGPDVDTPRGWTARLRLRADELGRLIRAGVLVAEGSGSDVLDRDLRQRWNMGFEAAALHVLPGMSAHDGVPVAERATATAGAVTLPAPGREGILGVMAGRRSCRHFRDTALEAGHVSAVLFAAAGVVGHKYDKHGRQHDLTPAPSGGACVPVSLRAVVRRVHGIQAGLYRYDPEAHRLCPIGALHGNEAEILAHDQTWAAAAPLLICFVADVTKTMRRYTGTAVYQAFPLEIGHRAQNVLLAAASLGLGTCVTASVDRKRASGQMGCHWPWESVLYTAAIGWAARRR